METADRPFDQAARPECSGQIYLQWLGQAGFLIATRETKILIDPYLSDSLRIKYPDSEFSHKRMSPAPVSPEELRGIDFFLSTHSHGDHLDPGTIEPVARNNPTCRFILPASQEDAALGKGVPKSRLLPASSGERIEVTPGIIVHPIPAAHEELALDSKGRHLFLGYVLETEGFTIYHSGDCVPYPGLVERLKAFHIDLALLPVNGRSAFLASRGVIGNFFLKEAYR
jgi:L-ascorbate metabolism protein UlaG (beta-lactamase superfamily)